MRFVKSGPIIPDFLLDQQEQGNLVFLCGAGISIKAGMPDFVDLTAQIIDELVKSEESTIVNEFKPWRNRSSNVPRIPLDVLYEMIQDEFSKDKVNSLVTEILSIDDEENRDLSQHEIIASLSTGKSKLPQIVTTNFDRIFESVVDTDMVPSFEPNNLPNIDEGAPITGITYLHGRLQDRDAAEHPYVLSSSEFGSAYLSKGAQTRFLRSIFKKFTIVLIGYSAEDPPIKYFLQGLKHEGESLANIYVFDRFKDDESNNKWTKMGVKPIWYIERTDLWKSCEAWRDMVKNPRNWHYRLISEAKKPANQVEPHIRGQVANMVRSESGAKLFSESVDSPHPSWILVFDRNFRIPKISSNNDQDQMFEIEDYMLDDDKLEDNGNYKGKNQNINLDLLGITAGVDNADVNIRLSEHTYPNSQILPQRLVSLAEWFVKHLSVPVTAHWASLQVNLHPVFRKKIWDSISQSSEIPPAASHAWRLILEFQSEVEKVTGDNIMEYTMNRVREGEWTPSILRNFKTITKPRIVANYWPNELYEPLIKIDDWNKFNEIAFKGWDIIFPKINVQGIVLPDTKIFEIFLIIESHFRRASSFLHDISKTNYDTPSCYNVNNIKNIENNIGIIEYISFFIKIYEIQLIENPILTKCLVENWSTNDPYFFRKFKLYALNNSTHYSIKQVADLIRNFPSDVFWDLNVMIELLKLIADRWQEFPIDDKIAIFDRILEGPPMSMNQFAVVRKRLYWTKRYVDWLIENGVQFPKKEQELEFEEISKEFSEIEYAAAQRNAEQEFDKSPVDLNMFDIKDIIPMATNIQKHSPWEKPFTELVKSEPAKALEAIKYEFESNNDIPEKYFIIYISHFNIDDDVVFEFLKFTHKLNNALFEKFIIHLTSWIRRSIESLYERDQETAWVLIDRMINYFEKMDYSPSTSLQTFSSATNSPIGRLVEAFLSLLKRQGLEPNSNIPVAFMDRIEKLLKSQEYNQIQATAILSSQFYWMFNIDSNWVQSKLTVWLSRDSSLSGPAWSGLLNDSSKVSNELMKANEDSIFDLFSYCYKLNLEQKNLNMASEWIVVNNMTSVSNKSENEVRKLHSCLRLMEEDTLCHIIELLGTKGSNGEWSWNETVIPFIDRVWPEELEYQTNKVVSSWVCLLGMTGKNFPEMFNKVRKYLHPSHIETKCFERFIERDKNGKSIVEKYPIESLELLNLIVEYSEKQSKEIILDILRIIVAKEPKAVQDERYLRLAKELDFQNK